MAFTTPSKGAGASTNTTMADSGASALTRHMQTFLRDNGIDAAVVSLFTAEEILANARELAFEQQAPATPPYVAPTPPSSAAPIEAPRHAAVMAGSIPYAALPSFQKRRRVEDEDEGDYAVTKKHRSKKAVPATTTTSPTTTATSKAKKAITNKTAAAPPPPPKVKDISFDVPAIPLKDLDWSEAPPRYATIRQDRIANFPPAALQPAEDGLCKYITQKYIDFLQGHVEYISFRLAAVTVMLYRADYHNEATQMGQFTVDFLGTGIYHTALHLYLKQTDEHDVWLHAEIAIADVIYYLRGGEKKHTRGDLFEESEKLKSMARGMGMTHGIIGEQTWTEKRAMGGRREHSNGRAANDDDLMDEEL